MPLFMDRHDVSAEVTAENVAQLHQEDLKIQAQFGCNGLTYWFDDARKTAFCLIEAPTIDAIKEMHREAHGDVPHEVIEVDATIVESFLGRIEDPKKSQNTELNIINDPAFRCVLAIRHPVVLSRESNVRHDFFHESLVGIIQKSDGRIVNHDFDGYLASFTTVSKAVSSALKLLSISDEALNKRLSPVGRVQIGISSGVPVNKQPGFFEGTIRAAKRLSIITKSQIVITTEVKELFESENLNGAIDKKSIYALNNSELHFLNTLIDYIDEKFSDEKINAEDFYKQLGFSKSRLYRKMIALVGKSPKLFLNEYRLNRSIELLKKANSTVSEVTFAVGFSSPSYFSKCFAKQFGIPPNYVRARNAGSQ